MENESSLKEIGSHKGKKNYLKMQLEISVFGNHAASRKSDKLLSATEQRQANGRNKEWPMRAIQKRSVLIQVKKKLSEDATSNLCVRKPRS